MRTFQYAIGRNHPRSMLSLLLIACLVGCTTVGPDYRAQDLNLPVGWHEPQPSFPTSNQESLQSWWRSFNDPMLDQLVAQALAKNQDLDIALARLQQARAERVQIAAGKGPIVAAGGGGEASRASGRLDDVSSGRSRTWRAGFDASWELDLFGGIRRAVESADAGIEALSHDRQALQVSLLAELTTSYAELRTAQARLAIAHGNIRNLRESEALAQRALQRGLGTTADVMQARAEREAAQAQPPVLEADIARLSHAIGVLAGGFPGDWRAALAEPSPVLPVAPALPPSLPSEVIRKRPDLQADERRLAAATAQIGVAEAARFPRFTIPLGIDTTASLIRDLFSGASLAWSAGMQASQTLYDGGYARAGVTAAQANANAAELAYQRDVRLALRDVEDALTSLNSERQRQVSLAAAVADSQQAVDRTTRLYQAGLSAYLPVLIAQRTANQARDSLALSQLGEVHGAISLYKALGAGWQDEP
ncbi:efflux transporter outer membrane subunit [Pseudomonas nabeulensis]|uniref:Efflux transporter outer membrane subunit n=2 Tax=Pseudomonas TaxID=286 RepID=A0A4Z0B3P7_9PSED|nr:MULTISPECIES: efflux transporter outer membrane subunit [Pseudomonas]MQT88051.1 efflux transporter outer membrane subunit [Pseudomonas helleri]TFY92848.1 efflux transporter outer membrane subunit [Pseudomonas nabeulensis]